MPHKKDCDNRDELGLDFDEPGKEFCMNCLGNIETKDDQFLKQFEFLD